MGVRLFPPPAGLLMLFWWTVRHTFERRSDLEPGWRRRMWRTTFWMIEHQHIRPGHPFDTLADYRRIWARRREMRARNKRIEEARADG